MRKLATLQLLASNGVLFIEDPDLPLNEVPDLDEFPVAAFRSRIVVQVQHAVDGLAAVSVLDGAVQTALPIEYYNGEFLSESGYMAVRDVVGWNRITLDIGKEPFRMKIFADEPEEPETLEIYVPGVE